MAGFDTYRTLEKLKNIRPRRTQKTRSIAPALHAPTILVRPCTSKQRKYFLFFLEITEKAIALQALVNINNKAYISIKLLLFLL